MELVQARALEQGAQVSLPRVRTVMALGQEGRANGSEVGADLISGGPNIGSLK